MGHTEEFLKRKWVKVCYFQCSQDCVFCHLWGGVGLPSIVVLQESQPGSRANISIATSWQEACSNKQLFWEEEEKTTKVGKKSCKGLHFMWMLPSAPQTLQTCLCCPGSCCLCSAKTTSLSLRHSWTPTAFLNSVSLLFLIHASHPAAGTPVHCSCTLQLQADPVFPALFVP